MSIDRELVEAEGYPLNLATAIDVVEGAQVKTLKRYREEDVIEAARKHAKSLLGVNAGTKTLPAMLAEVVQGIADAIKGIFENVGNVAATTFTKVFDGVRSVLTGIANAFAGAFGLTPKPEPTPVAELPEGETEAEPYNPVFDVAIDIRDSIDFKINETRNAITEGIENVESLIEKQNAAISNMPNSIVELININTETGEAIEHTKEQIEQAKALNEALLARINEGVEANEAFNKLVADTEEALSKFDIIQNDLTTAIEDGIKASQTIRDMTEETARVNSEVVARGEEISALNRQLEAINNGENEAINAQIVEASADLSERVENMQTDFEAKARRSGQAVQSAVPLIFGTNTPSWTAPLEAREGGSYALKTATVSVGTADSNPHAAVDAKQDYVLSVTAKTADSSPLVVYLQDPTMDGSTTTTAVQSYDGTTLTGTPVDSTNMSINLGTSPSFTTADVVVRFKPGTSMIRVGRFAGGVGTEIKDITLVPYTAFHALEEAQRTSTRLWGEQGEINQLNAAMWDDQGRVNQNIVAVQNIHNGLWDKQSKLNDMQQQANASFEMFQSMQGVYNENNAKAWQSQADTNNFFQEVYKAQQDINDIQTGNWNSQWALNDRVQKGIDGLTLAQEQQQRINDINDGLWEEQSAFNKLQEEINVGLKDTDNELLRLIEYKHLLNHGSAYIPSSEDGVVRDKSILRFTGVKGECKGVRPIPFIDGLDESGPVVQNGAWQFDEVGEWSISFGFTYKQATQNWSNSNEVLVRLLLFGPQVTHVPQNNYLRDKSVVRDYYLFRDSSAQALTFSHNVTITVREPGEKLILHEYLSYRRAKHTGMEVSYLNMRQISSNAGDPNWFNTPHDWDA